VERIESIESFNYEINWLIDLLTGCGLLVCRWIYLYMCWNLYFVQGRSVARHAEPCTGDLYYKTV